MISLPPSFRWAVRWAWPAIAAVVLLIACSRFLGFIVTDDTYIDYRFAQNLSDGLGFVFNAGERVEGYSNFLWVLLISALLKLGIDPIVGSKLLGVACAVLSLFAMAALADRVAPRRQQTSGIACLLLATSVPFVVWSVSGLETPFYLLLVTLALYLHVRFVQDGRRSRTLLVASSLTFVALALTRAEGPILFVAVFCLDWIDTTSERRTLWLWAAIFLAIYVSYFVWRSVYFESLLPNSVHAKAGGGTDRLVLGFHYVREFVRDNEGAAFYLAIAGVWARRRGLDYALRLLLVCLFTLIAFTVYAGGDWMIAYRLVVPALPIAYLLVQEGAAEIWRLIRVVPRAKRVAFALAAVIGVLIVRESAYRTVMARMIRENVKWGNYEQLGRWMKSNLPSQSLVALGSAGIIPFYSGMRIVDMYGLMDTTIARQGRAEQEGAIFTRTYATYVLSRKPDYILLYGTWKESARGMQLEGTTPYSRDMLSKPEFEAAYAVMREQCRRAACDGSEKMVLYSRIGG